ncbi:NAD(P)-binding protein [Macrolepiota fuliginosa MF-IS2]|uniref:NAD(P)-binding protein n=1 Tax=Macrolepiota fuliginosa MF-IS2 TaxID=1400762 RepID=A0A9P6CA22_9AGAR|nr:NAD(P)-binding protein [Macrolepiota fuliginosa MF-IS2]
MNPALRRILVVGGNGFIAGSAVCKLAVARGIQVTSVSSSGKPYRTAKGHTPAWANKVVDWQKGDALHPESFAHLLPEVSGVVHTLGTLFEDADGAYKRALRSGDVPGLLGSFFKNVVTGGNGGNPLEKHQQLGAVNGRGTYEIMNRDSALRVCEAFVCSTPSSSADGNMPRPFVYISAEDIFRPVIPARYIETKREAERGIEELMANNTDYRGIYIRPSLVYHAHQRPLTTPAAVLFDLSATLHANVPRGVPTPSGILRSLGTLMPQGSRCSAGSLGDPGVVGTLLESMASALEVPPIHVDHVAGAIVVALDSASGIRGVVGVRRMRQLIGWSESGGNGSPKTAQIEIGSGL